MIVKICIQVSRLVSRWCSYNYNSLPAATDSSGVVQTALSFAVHQNLVVDAKLALRHSAEVAFHHYTTSDMGAQHLTCCIIKTHR